MFQRLTGLASLVALVGSLVAISPSPALAQTSNPNTNRLTVPITGATDTANLTGTLAITRFAIQNGQLVAIGTLTGTLTNTTTGLASTFVSQLTAPVANATGTCDVLNLVLGPLDLNLLGLEIHLNQVVLDIVAVPGSGNLLGALAGL